MNLAIVFIGISVITIGILAYVLFRYSLLKKEWQSSENEREQLQQKCNHLQQTQTILQGQASDNQAYTRQLEERCAIYSNWESIISKSISEEIKNQYFAFQQKSQEQIVHSNKEHIAPWIEHVQSSLKEIQKFVTDQQQLQQVNQESLNQQLLGLLNETTQLRGETQMLQHTLKGNPTQTGSWGEVILLNLLEQTGLREGHDFFTQKGFSAEGKSLRPDLVLRIPGKRHIVVDCKFSIKNLFDPSGTSTQTSLTKDQINEHIKRIKEHIKNLASKKYHHIEEMTSPDFTILFIPVENAFTLTIDNAPEILTEAWKQQVLLASPSTLMLIVRMIRFMWQQEKQSQNAEIIAREAGKLYDRFYHLFESVEKNDQLLKKLADNQDRIKNIVKNGNGNLLNRVERLKSLGAQSGKDLGDFKTNQNHD